MITIVNLHELNSSSWETRNKNGSFAVSLGFDLEEYCSPQMGGIIKRVCS